MEFELSKSRLRPWLPGDEQSLVRHANNRKVWRNLRDAFPHPYTLADARQWIQIANPSPPITNFAIIVDGAAVGGIGRSRYEMEKNATNPSGDAWTW